MGLLWGVDLVRDRETREPDLELGVAVTKRCMALGLNMDIGGDLAAIKRIAPPLTVKKQEIDRAIEILDTALTECR
jgi:2,2-dialkylglycine decarboxylase (pyruvate)